MHDLKKNKMKSHFCHPHKKWNIPNLFETPNMTPVLFFAETLSLFSESDQ